MIKLELRNEQREITVTSPKRQPSGVFTGTSEHQYGDRTASGSVVGLTTSTHAMTSKNQANKSSRHSLINDQQCKIHTTYNFRKVQSPKQCKIWGLRKAEFWISCIDEIECLVNEEEFS